MSTQSDNNQAGLASVGAGAAAGAVAGSFIPGVGTVIGAGVGAMLGGLAGSFGIGRKAKKNAKRARAIQMEREQNAQDAQYLAMVRRARLARSGSLAASTAYGLASSSLASSALSSIGSQSQYSIQYTANDQRLLQAYNRYVKKASDLSKSAQLTMQTGQLVGTAAFAYGAFASAGASATAAANEAMAGESTLGVITPSAVQVDGWTTAYNSAFSSSLLGNLYTANTLTNLTGSFAQAMNSYNQI